MAGEDARLFGKHYRWWMSGLTLLLVPIWCVVAWLSLFLLTIAGAGASVPPFFGNFDLRHTAIIVLVFPLGALALGWYGVARASRWAALAGTVLLAAWQLLLPSFYLYARIFASPTPGGWADRDFQIPKGVRSTYLMTRFGHVLVVQSPSRRLLVAKASEARLPSMASVEVRVRPYPRLAPKEGLACEGRLREVSYSWRASSGEENLLTRNFFGAASSEVSALYLSADGRSLARCGIHGMCDLLFDNNRFLTEFLVRRDDLCHAAELNRRLVKLVAVWVR